MHKWKLFVLISVSLIFSFFALFIGPIPLSIESILNGFSESEATVFFDIRIPRVLLGFSIGVILSVAGVLYQTVFKNMLADPFTLGVSSGASLGASIYTILFSSFFIQGGTAIFALIGAILSIFFVLFLSKITKRNESEEVLLCGIVVSFFCSSFILFLQYVSDSNAIVMMSRWFMGGLGNADLTSGLIALASAVIISFFALKLSSNLDLTLLGDEISYSHGVNVLKFQRCVLILVSCIVGISVALAGPIGFVGIMIPHITRKMFGSRHVPLILGAIFIGGAFLVSADAISRLIIKPAELPVGVVTSLLGGPFFVWVMVTSKKQV